MLFVSLVMERLRIAPSREFQLQVTLERDYLISSNTQKQTPWQTGTGVTIAPATFENFVKLCRKTLNCFNIYSHKIHIYFTSSTIFHPTSLKSWLYCCSLAQHYPPSGIQRQALSQLDYLIIKSYFPIITLIF